MGTTTVNSLKSEFAGKKLKFSDRLEGEVCTEMAIFETDDPNQTLEYILKENCEQYPQGPCNDPAGTPQAPPQIRTHGPMSSFCRLCASSIVSNAFGGGALVGLGTGGGA